jgi:hypothetical protein
MKVVTMAVSVQCVVMVVLMVFVMVEECRELAVAECRGEEREEFPF